MRLQGKTRNECYVTTLYMIHYCACPSRMACMTIIITLTRHRASRSSGVAPIDSV